MFLHIYGLNLFFLRNGQGVIWLQFMKIIHMRHSNETKGIVSFAVTWIDLGIIILSEVSQKEKDTYDITYIWNLKYDANEHIYETETDNRLVTKGEGGEGGMIGSLGLADVNWIYIW